MGAEKREQRVSGEIVTVTVNVKGDVNVKPK